MGTHIDTRTQRRQKVKEHDRAARSRRATFKQYLRQIEEELIEDDLQSDEDLHDTQDEADEQSLAAR